jgi:ABC-2 type transport system permease protein
LPLSLQMIISFTPFPYLIYYPVAIYLGKFQGMQLLLLLAQFLAVCGVWYIVMASVWQKGLRVFGAEGR